MVKEVVVKCSLLTFEEIKFTIFIIDSINNKSQDGKRSKNNLIFHTDNVSSSFLVSASNFFSSMNGNFTTACFTEEITISPQISSSQISKQLKSYQKTTRHSNIAVKIPAMQNAFHSCQVQNLKEQKNLW